MTVVLVSLWVSVGEYAGLEPLVKVLHEGPLTGSGVPALQHLPISGHTDTHFNSNLHREVCKC